MKWQWDCAGCGERITAYPPGAFDPDDRTKRYCHGCYDVPEQSYEDACYDAIAPTRGGY